MFRIDSPGATQDNSFTEGNPATGTRATAVSADWLNAVQEELAKAIEGSGQELNKSDSGQLLKALASRVIYVDSVAELLEIGNPIEGQQALVDGAPYKYTGGVWLEVFASDGRLDDGFYRASDSGELFQLPTGVNEFDILFEDGFFHLFYDDKTQTKHRQSATIQGLAIAADDLTIAGRYPSVIFDSGEWHLFLWDQGNGRTDRYTSSSATGPYVFQETVAAGKADFAVAKNPGNGGYVAAYKESSGSPDDNLAGILTADSLAGPWTDRGIIFTAGERAAWHEAEEADPVPVFFNGRMFVVFAGWPTVGYKRQRVGIVELDPSFNPVTSPRILVEAVESWQNGPQGFKVFSPRVLTVGGVTRLFYSHNPGASVPAGWAYLDYNERNAPADSRHIYSSKPLALTPVTNILNFKLGPIKTIAGYSSFDGATQAIHALSPLGKFDEFTIIINLSNVPAVTGAQTVFCASADPDSGNFVKVGIDASGNVFASLRNGIGADISFSTGFRVDDSSAHSIVLRRNKSGDVTFFTDFDVQSEGSMLSPITGIQLVKIGNDKGISEPAGQQFIGECKVEIYDRALPISTVSLG